ncbi:MAG TPA: hypothetical protein VGC13_07080 [Longimicrobium sp.]|jgi:hypothetical protein|uniref:hypothetical protein n=1 Tax=Longimicrobium sp. TaxID=2029185 RepID=UPI002ED9F6AC
MTDSTTTSGRPADAIETPRRRVHAPPAAAAREGGWMRLLRAAVLVCLPVLAAPWISRAIFPRPSSFNSDLAIPVLMMRAREWSLFDVYYWGQDRLGAWHVLLMRGIGQLRGHPFDYAALHLVGTAWVLAAAVVMVRLAGAWGWAAGGLMAAVLVGSRDSRFWLFDAAHPYAWQITALMLAWWGLRRLAERPASAGRGRWILRAATAFAAFLAHWMSPLSGPLLMIVAGIEAVRGRVLDAAPGRSLLRRLGEGGMAVAAAMVGERVLRAAFDQYSYARYGEYFRTGLVLDRGHLADNARRVAKTLAESDSMPLLLVATAGAFAAVAVLWRARGGREPGWRVEGAALVLACWALAAAQLPVFVLVRHVRVNHFAERYFSLVFVFGALAGLLTLAGLAASLPPLAPRRRQVLAVAGAAGLVVGALRVPAAQPPRPNATVRMAARLEVRAPGAPLLGGYWNTYVLAALQQPETMLHPVPCEGRMVRTPWWAEELPRHRWVVVAHTNECLDAGPPESPAPWLYQHGALLRLARARWEGGGGVTVSLYENATARAVAHQVEPAVAGWRYCDAGAALRLRFPARGAAQVMVARVARSPGAVMLAAPVFADGRVGPPVKMSETGRLHGVELRADGAPLVGARITVQRTMPLLPRQTCLGANSFVVGE